MEDFYYKNKDLDLTIDMVLYEYEQNDVLLICRDKKKNLFKFLLSLH